MLHRKLVSEEVTVLDLWINHGGDSEGGVEGSVTHAALLHSRHADFWRIHQRANEVGGGLLWALAARRGVQQGWQVCWVEGWLRGLLWQEGESRDRDGEKILFSNFGLITAALWNPTFQTIRWKLPVSPQRESLITITKGREKIGERERSETQWQSRELTPPVIAADGPCRFYWYPCSWAHRFAVFMSRLLTALSVKVSLLVSLGQSQRVTWSFVMSS